MYLCLDCGNTTIVCALCDNDKIIKVRRVDTNIYNDADYYFETCFKNFAEYHIEGVIISSVVPSIDKTLKEVFEKHFRINPKFVDPTIPYKLDILIENKFELGSDLFIAALGALKYNLGNVMICDLGTANKFLVLKGNEFLGGAIAPGLMSSLKNMFKDAEMLQSVKLDTPNKVVGNSTIKCIQSGSIYGTAVMIEGMKAKFESEVGPLTMILTGGNADYIKDALAIDFIWAPNLLIEGLIDLYLNE